VRHAALRWLRARAPNLYWRGRNAAALAGLYVHRLSASRADAYDDGFWDFHAVGDWTGFARAVLAYAPARSIADIGCGHGLAMDGFRQVDPTIDLRGYDDSESARRRAHERGLTVEPLDIVATSQAAAVALARDLSTVDLGVCLEVAEHLPPWHADKLLTIVAAPRRLVFSAAHPNQGGRFHVNEQPAQYWIRRLARHGLVLSSRDAEFRRDVAALDLPWWYAANVHLFERR